jgi:hypothetical protein
MFAMLGVTICRLIRIAGLLKCLQRSLNYYRASAALTAHGIYPSDASIHIRNEGSMGLVKKMGMSQVDFIANADHFKGMDSEKCFFTSRIDLE